MDWKVGGGAQIYGSQNFLSNNRLPAQDKLLYGVDILEV